MITTPPSGKATPASIAPAKSPYKIRSGLQPTIHIDQGARISIMVARDLDFEAVEMALLANQR